MAPLTRWLGGALVVLIASACSSSSDGEVDPALSSILPTATELPLSALGLDDDATIVEFAGPTEWERNGFYPSYTAREGRAGDREYSITEDPVSDPPNSPDEIHQYLIDGHPGTGVTMLLYERSSVAEAQSLWRASPPEVAHRDWVGDLDRSEEEVARVIDDWRIPWTSRLEGVDAEAICLANVDDRCYGAHGWVRFCNWVMEIQISAQPDPRIDDDFPIGEVFDDLAATVMRRVSCPGST